jgi:hypothetical protein
LRRRAGSCSWNGSGGGGHRRPRESRPDGLDGGDEEAEELDLVRVAVDIHQDAATGPDHARHLSNTLRHVREQHDAELRPGHVEGVVGELERVPVHHPGLDIEALLARTPTEQVEHDGRLVGCQHTRAEARAAGMLRAPLPAATSRKRMPRSSPARRRPSFPSHIWVGVLVRS